MDFCDATAAPALLGDLCAEELLALRAVSSGLRNATRGPMIAVLVAALGKRRRAQPLQAVSQRALLLRTLAGEASGGDKLATVTAAQCLRDVRHEVRHAAARALEKVAGGAHEGEAIVACLGPAIGDNDPRVSLAVARVLPRLAGRGNRVAINAAAAHLGSLSPMVRQASLLAYAGVVERGCDAAIEAIANMARTDSDWRVRAAAVRALPQVAARGDVVALKALTESLDDENMNVRKVAAGAIVHIADAPSAPFFARLRSPPKFRRPAKRRRPNSMAHRIH